MDNDEELKPLSKHEWMELGTKHLYNPESEPLFLYIINHDEIKGADLKRDMFYFGKRGLTRYLNTWHSLFDNIYKSRREEDIYWDRKISKFGKRVRNELITLEENETDSKVKSLNEELMEASWFYHVLKDWALREPVLALRCLDNEMPYQDFLKFGRMDYSNRLWLKLKNILDYGYEDDIQTAYLNDRVANIVDAVYGEDIIERFEKEEVNPKIQL